MCAERILPGDKVWEVEGEEPVHLDCRFGHDYFSHNAY
jgi:hypothetical protein